MESSWRAKPYTLHIYIRDPTLIAWLESLPKRQRSRAIEAVLRQGLERADPEHLSADVEAWAKRIADEVLKGIQARQSVVAAQPPQTPKSPEIPRNPVTAFLQRWDLD
ncbi:hypothetical protein [Alicyclobacillus fructus]|uniref:hypothetical protein n=1 Tax=Alicyclobacillus fructus TaxID=2816082 RepID=UPI001F3B26C3|nr:hypothetical protein [Alicyclobacillus fructus]